MVVWARARLGRCEWCERCLAARGWRGADVHELRALEDGCEDVLVPIPGVCVTTRGMVVGSLRRRLDDALDRALGATDVVELASVTTTDGAGAGAGSANGSRMASALKLE